ncbi:MAG: hypothetical protein N4A36_01810 [Candidatus Gracilibacteria bacterium]|nr:hypothetical protein [Candidatus Gracilibacteria bacterium]
MTRHYKLSFILETDDADREMDLLMDNLNIAPSSLEIEDVELESLIQESERQIEKSQTYLDDLEDFYKETELVCAEYQIENPYVETIEKALNNKDLKEEEKAEIEILREFAKRAPKLSLIKKYLIDFPDTKEFEELIFQQNLVKINLDLPKALIKPRRIDETVMQAFENYKKLYVKKYITMIKSRNSYLKDFWIHEKGILKKLLALKTLGNIEALGDCPHSRLHKEFERLKTDYFPENIDESVLKKALDKGPEWKNISIIGPYANEICERFLNELDFELEKKFSFIKTKGVLDLLNKSKKDSVQKLTKAVTLTDIKKIVSLFNSKTAPVIAHELKKLLSGDDLDTIRLGDFDCSLEKLETEQDIKQASEEFEKFLRTRKKDKNCLIIQ